MKKIILSIFVLSTFWANAQNQKVDLENGNNPFNQKIEGLKIENSKLRNQIKTISNELSKTNFALDSLRNLTEANSKAINQTNQELGLKIKTTERTTNKKFTQVDNSLSENSLWSIIGILGAIIISGFVYWLVSKRQTTDKTDVEEQISKTKKTLEEEGVKLDTKLTEVLETQLKLVQEERANIPANRSDEIDHSLALKVADEIVRINKNLSNMDEGTKGLKQLSASVKRIEDNFAANGYEMPELLNKPFDPRMKMIANMIEDENLEKGVEIITKIIKPQVNFRGVMIQSAQVEVSVGQ
jgi:hypothetical protein